MDLTKPRRHKHVPALWWDFDSDYNVIIESDHPDYPIVTTACSPDQANKIIADIVAGRSTLKEPFRCLG